MWEKKILRKENKIQGRKVMQGKLKLNPIHEEFDQA